MSYIQQMKINIAVRSKCLLETKRSEHYLHNDHNLRLKLIWSWLRTIWFPFQAIIQLYNAQSALVSVKWNRRKGLSRKNPIVDMRMKYWTASHTCQSVSSLVIKKGLEIYLVNKRCCINDFFAPPLLHSGTRGHLQWTWLETRKHILHEQENVFKLNYRLMLWAGIQKI